MWFPPDIQRRLAVMAELSQPEQVDLHRDIVEFAKGESRTRGGLTWGTYPNLFPVNESMATSQQSTADKPRNLRRSILVLVSRARERFRPRRG